MFIDSITVEFIVPTASADVSHLAWPSRLASTFHTDWLEENQQPTIPVLMDQVHPMANTSCS